MYGTGKHGGDCWKRGYGLVASRSRFTVIYRVRCPHHHVDKGALALVEQGIVPDYAIGDFDSVTESELLSIRRATRNVVVYPKEKDKTDLELAIEAGIAMHPAELVLLGCTGGRIDHELSALHLLAGIHKASIHGRIVNACNEIRLVAGRIRIPADRRFPYVSVIPLTEEIRVSISGCRYPLDSFVVCRETGLGVSNVIVMDHADIDI